VNGDYYEKWLALRQLHTEQAELTARERDRLRADLAAEKSANEELHKRLAEMVPAADLAAAGTRLRRHAENEARLESRNDALQAELAAERERGEKAERERDRFAFSHGNEPLIAALRAQLDSMEKAIEGRDEAAKHLAGKLIHGVAKRDTARERVAVLEGLLRRARPRLECMVGISGQALLHEIDEALAEQPPRTGVPGSPEGGA
jgi:soluble cytochrome b562